MVDPWKRVEPTTVQKIGRRTVATKTFVLPDGLEHEFAIIGDGTQRSAAVIALTSDNMVIVARQFRPGPERIMDELPGGGVEAGEDPKDAVVRELREETGYIAGEVTYLGETCYDAYTDSHRYSFIATNCTLHEDGQQLDEHEYVETMLISIDQLIENARQGRLTDPGAVLLAYDTLMELKSSTNTVQ